MEHLESMVMRTLAESISVRECRDLIQGEGASHPEELPNHDGVDEPYTAAVLWCSTWNRMTTIP